MTSKMFYLWPSLFGEVSHGLNDVHGWINGQKRASHSFIKMLSGDYSSVLEAAPYIVATNRLGYKLKTITHSIQFNMIPDGIRNKFLLEINSHVVYKESVERSLGKAAKRPYDVKALKAFIESGYDWNSFKATNRKRLTRIADINLGLSICGIKAIETGKRAEISASWANGLIRSFVTKINKDEITTYHNKGINVIANSGAYLHGMATKMFIAYDCAHLISEEERELVGARVWDDCTSQYIVMPEEVPDQILIDGLHEFVESRRRCIPMAEVKAVVAQRPALTKHVEDYFKVRQVHD